MEKNKIIDDFHYEWISLNPHYICGGKVYGRSIGDDNKYYCTKCKKIWRVDGSDY